jgi:hypothetical protein
MASNYSWRYQVIKRYKRRATHFYDMAKTDEEKEAWLQVIKWFSSIMHEGRVSTKTGVIGLAEILPEVDLPHGELIV